MPRQPKHPEPPYLPPRKPTRGSRFGNGGYGGPAKGPEPTLKEKMARYLALTPEERRQLRATRAAQAEVLADRLVEVAMSNENVACNAAATFVRITGLMPPERVDSLVRVSDTIDRPPAETREEWIARREREQIAALGAPAGAAG